MEKINKMFRNFYEGKLYPMEWIYKQAENNDTEFNILNKRAEEIVSRLKENCDDELVDEYADILIKQQHIISMYSFQCGIKLGLHFAKDS